MKKLVVVHPGAISVASSGEIKISQKTVSGMMQFQKRWKGDVMLIAQGNWSDENVILDGAWHSLRDLPFSVHLTRDLVQTISDISPDIVLAPHTRGFEGLLDLPIPVVYTTENPTLSWMREDLRLSRGVVDRIRILAGAIRLEKLRRVMVKRSAGIQCNGWPAWDAYSKYSDDAILFYDTRLPQDKVEQFLSSEKEFIPTGVLRLGFSGRFAPGKGPESVIALEKKLTELGIAHTLVMVGAGEMEDDLKRLASPSVRFISPMDFEAEWIDWAHQSIDLMVLTHVLGDPSGTYLESVGTATPIIGFDNVALKALVEKFGIGWVVPLGDIDELAQTVARLSRQPEALKERAERGLRFMLEHSQEREFDKRIQHLEKILAKNLA
ncbi:MAG: glycosyltransferase family 4 protein [Actinomycetales bacterium]|nr:glycosyltransferase family 4 protein [Actinomycetales bacterium]